MVYIRANSWSMKDEERLAEIVLDGIRSGDTVDVIMRRASEEFGRSAGGCKFHWYGCLKAAYEDEVQQARMSAASTGNTGG